MKQFNIAVIVGSLRKDSFNLKMAHALIEKAPESLSFEILQIRDLGLYSQEFDQNYPKEWVDFKEKVKNADGVLFITPEYNRSVPGVLKNAIDVGSRPWGQSAWGGKPAAIVSVTIGGLGGFGASNHLRQSLAFLGMPTMTQPEAYISNASSLFDESGKLIDESTVTFSQKYMAAFALWVENFVV